MCKENNNDKSQSFAPNGKPLKGLPFDISNMKFETPSLQLYCKKCKTTNYFYDDNEPPCKCDRCGTVLNDNNSEPIIDGA